MGFISTSDSYNLRGNDVLQGLHNVHKIVDDILIEDSSIEDHLKHVKEVLDRCRKKKISLNPEKFQFAKEKVTYPGYGVTADGIAADKKKLTAITLYPDPTNRTELRSFMSMVNQLSQFSSTISKVAYPPETF